MARNLNLSKNHPIDDASVHGEKQNKPAICPMTFFAALNSAAANQSRMANKKNNVARLPKTNLMV